MAARPKLGISLRSLARDASDFEERLTAVSNYKPDSIELSCFAQDLIFNRMVIVARAEKMVEVRREGAARALSTADQRIARRELRVGCAL